MEPRAEAPSLAGAPAGRASAVQRGVLLAAALASLALLGWVLLNCRAGFDFTDEGFYLNWIAHPWLYRASVSQFGFVYHPLDRLVGGDVVRLRQANILILFGLAWLLCRTLFGLIHGEGAAAAPASRAGLGCLAFAAASAALLLLRVWLPTPSYNSLTFQSMMLAVTGALLAGRAGWRGVTGWLMIGIGGGIAFLAKPPSAALLGLLLAGYLVLVRRFRPAGLLVAVVTAGLLVALAAFAIDGSLSGFVRRVIEGLDLSNRRLGVAHTSERLFSLQELVASAWRPAGLAGFLGVLLVTTGLGVAAIRLARPMVVLFAAVFAALCALSLSQFWHPSLLRAAMEWMMQPLQLAAIVVGVVLVRWLTAKMPLRAPAQPDLALFGLLLALPCAFAFGTNSPYWPTAADAALFWLLAGYVACLDPSARSAWQNALPAIALSLLLSAGVLLAATDAPYRQTEPLNRQHDAIDVPPRGARLFVSATTANYVWELRKLAAANGFNSGDVVLDLTGESPGSLYAIAATPLAVPWTLGGYPGSAAFVAAALDTEPCEKIALSWVLDAPGSANSISANVLAGQGVDLSTDYVVVGSVQGPAGVAAPDIAYRLLRPARSPQAAEAACAKARHR